MQPTPPCPVPPCKWQVQVSALLLCWDSYRWVRNLWVLFIYFLSQLCCPLCFQGSPQTRQWECFLLCGNFSFMTPSPGQSLSLNLLSLFLSFIFCPTYFWRSWAAFLVPGVLHKLSEVVLWNLLNIQMIFWWISWARKWSPCLIPLPSWDSHTITAKLSSYKGDHVIYRTENGYYLNLYR